MQYYRLGFVITQADAPAGKQVREIRAKLKDLAALNKQIGIGAIFQNHSPSGRGYVGGDLADMYEIVKDFDPAQIGVAFDIGHALVVHGDDWRRHSSKLKSHIKVAYIKDVKRGQALGALRPRGHRLDGLLQAAEANGLPGTGLLAHRVRLERQREVQNARRTGQGVAGEYAGVKTLAFDGRLRTCLSPQGRVALAHSAIIYSKASAQPGAYERLLHYGCLPVGGGAGACYG